MTPRLVVAIPARDEAARITAALRSVRAAAEELRAVHPDVVVTVVVAADSCTDSTGALALAAGAHVVETTAGRVGAARAAAVGRGLELDPAATWIACTDADSRVPVRWLLAQAEAAGAGLDVLLGSIRPDPRELSAALLHEWARRNPPAERHGHVHGANLGIGVAAYRAARGFEDVETDEDVALVGRCRALGLRVGSTDRAPVITSARLRGRAPGGFNGYLRLLDDPLGA